MSYFPKPLPFLQHLKKKNLWDLEYSSNYSGSKAQRRAAPLKRLGDHGKQLTTRSGGGRAAGAATPLGNAVEGMSPWP